MVQYWNSSKHKRSFNLLLSLITYSKSSEIMVIVLRSALFGFYIVLRYYNFVGSKEDWWEIRLARQRIERVGCNIVCLMSLQISRLANWVWFNHNCHIWRQRMPRKKEIIYIPQASITVSFRLEFVYNIFRFFREAT